MVERVASRVRRVRRFPARTRTSPSAARTASAGVRTTQYMPTNALTSITCTTTPPTSYTYNGANELTALNGSTTGWSYDGDRNETAGNSTTPRTSEQYSPRIALASVSVRASTTPPPADLHKRTRAGKRQIATHMLTATINSVDPTGRSAVCSGEFVILGVLTTIAVGLSGLTLGVSIVVGAVADILIGVGDLIVCDQSACEAPD
jgi:hypothetical protein